MGLEGGRPFEGIPVELGLKRTVESPLARGREISEGINPYWLSGFINPDTEPQISLATA